MFRCDKQKKLESYLGGGVIVQILEQNDPFGRIGSEFGKGLAQQIPKEIERKRLSEGIKKFSPELAEAYNVPGVLDNPQVAQQLMQYVQSNRAKEAVRGRQSSGMPGINVPNAIQEARIPGQQGSQSSQERPTQFNRESSNYLRPDSADEIDRKAVDLSDRTGLPFSQAQEIEQRNSDKRIASESAFEARASLGSQEFNKELDSILQKQGLESNNDIPYEMRTEYDNLVRNDIDNGASPIQAAKSRAKQLLDIAKVRQQLSTEAVKKFYSTTPSASRKSIRDIRKAYKDVGKLELYKQDLTSKVGMSPSYASSVAFPVSEHPEIKSEISKVSENPKKTFDKIVSSLGKNDSLQSIAVALENKGGRGTGERFFDTIRALNFANDVDLTERQARELNEGFKYNPSLTDVWYTSLLGKRGEE